MGESGGGGAHQLEHLKSCKYQTQLLTELDQTPLKDLERTWYLATTMRTRWYCPSRTFSGNNMNTLFLSGSSRLTSDKGSILSIPCKFDSMPFLLSFVYLLHGFQSQSIPLTSILAQSSTLISTPGCICPADQRMMETSFGAASPPFFLVHGFPFIPTFLAPLIFRGESFYVVSNLCSGLYSVRKW